MPSVYIAGPMRGHPQLNWPAFDKAAALGRSLGWIVISPAEMDREAGISADAVPEFQVRGGGDVRLIRELVRKDANVIINRLRAEDGDAIALLPGWEMGVGTLGEVGLGLWLKLRFLDAETFYPMEAELKGLSFRPGLVSECKGGLCGVNRYIRETADRIANQPE